MNFIICVIKTRVFINWFSNFCDNYQKCIHFYNYFPNFFAIFFSFKRIVFATFSENFDSMNSLELLKQIEFSLLIDTMSKITKRNTKRKLFNFVFEMNMWYETKKITKKNYTSFREILNLNQSKFENVLFTRLSILLKWCKERLSISTLHKIQMSIFIKKQFFKISNNIANLYYFDSRILCVLILNIHDVKNRVYFEMTQIIKNSKKLWQSKI